MRTLRHALTTGGTLLSALLIFAAFTAAQAASTLTTLYNFTGGSDGFHPISGVVIGSGGVLYGTTFSYGSFTNTGTAFSLTPPASPGGAWNLATLLAARV